MKSPLVKGSPYPQRLPAATLEGWSGGQEVVAVAMRLSLAAATFWQLLARRSYAELGVVMIGCFLVGGDWNHGVLWLSIIFGNFMEFHHPNWRSPSFFRGFKPPSSFIFLMEDWGDCRDKTETSISSDFKIKKIRDSPWDLIWWDELSMNIHEKVGLIQETRDLWTEI